MKKRVWSICLSVLLVAASFCLGFFARSWTNPDLAALDFISRQYKKNYLDADENYVSTMANSVLDRYSRYYTAEEYDALKQSDKGVRAGIGATFLRDGLTIYSVNGNSPAEKAGVVAGGKVKAIKSITDTDFEEIQTYDRLKAKLDSISANQAFAMKILYGEEEKIFELAKEDYRETFVFYEDDSSSYRFNDANGSNMSFVRYSDGNPSFDSSTAYLKYTSFSGTESGLNGSVGQIAAAMNKFKTDGKTKLILDLRSNGGGFMDILESVAAHFIDAEDGSKVLISKAIYKDGSEEKFVSDKVDYSAYNFEKIIILANVDTASASEALIGAILDYDKKGIASVVLSAYKLESGLTYRTYGKGIMQTTYVNPLSGDALRLTTAKIYWPLSGETIHGVGVTKNLSRYSDRIFEPTVVDGVDYELEFAVEKAKG